MGKEFQQGLNCLNEINEWSLIVFPNRGLDWNLAGNCVNYDSPLQTLLEDYDSQSKMRIRGDQARCGSNCLGCRSGNCRNPIFSLMENKKMSHKYLVSRNILKFEKVKKLPGPMGQLLQTLMR